MCIEQELFPKYWQTFIIKIKVRIRIKVIIRIRESGIRVLYSGLVSVVWVVWGLGSHWG